MIKDFIEMQDEVALIARQRRFGISERRGIAAQILEQKYYTGLLGEVLCVGGS